MAFWNKKKKASSPTKRAKGGGTSELDKQIINLMEQLNIPKSGRDGVLKLPEAQKKMMLEQYKTKLTDTKPSESGKDWSNKFKHKHVDRKLLQEFTVVIKASDSKFAEEFIQELGLKRLCRVAAENSSCNTQILLIFKALIDTSQTIIKDIINNDLTVTTIVSKVDSADTRVRELSIKLLITLVIVEDDDLSLLASSKIMSSLLDSARMRGYRNRWKSVLSHLSVNELSRSGGLGSFEYDNYALMLINFIITGLETVEERTDERRLLNSLRFSESLTKLWKSIDDNMNVMEAKSPSGISRSDSGTLSRADSLISIKSDSATLSKSESNHTENTVRQSPPKRARGLSNHQIQLQQYQYCQSVTTQITAYNRFREEDLAELRKAGIIDDENDLSSPKGLFKVVHDQALDDGFINELTSILKNFVTIPASGDLVWHNLNKIVSAACAPTQSKYKLPASSSTAASTANSERTYLSFQELQHLLKVQTNEEEKEKELQTQNNQTALKLDEERKKVDELETQVQRLQSNITTLQAAAAAAVAANARLPPQIQGYRGGLPAPSAYSGGGLPPPAPIPSSGGLPPPAATPEPAPVPVPVPVPVAAAPDKYVKYRKMIKMKIPKAAIVNKMKQAGIDIAILQKYELTGQLPPIPQGMAAPAPLPTAAAAPVVPDGLDKYRRMIKMKIPKAAVLNKMKQGGVALSVMQKYELTGKLPPGGGTAPAAAPTPPGLPPPAPSPTALTKEEEVKLAKYQRMKKMKLPNAAIRNKMKQDGIDSGLIARFLGEGSGGGTASTAGPTAPKVKAKPKWPDNLKRKTAIKPSRKMKNLQWTTVDPFSIEKSIWKEVDDGKIKIDRKELEEMFGQKIIAKKVHKSAVGRKKKAAVELIHILDGKRSYNVEIYLGRLRMDPFTCKDMLLNMDEETKFDAEQVSKLQNFVPTPEETQMFADLDPGDEKNLAKAEKFFYTIKNIDKNLPQRLELWAFKMNFDKIFGVEQGKVYALYNARECIQRSQSLRELFSTILAFGNFMNGGTRKGCAHGFKLKSLSQLTRSRSTDNKVTLMEYLYLYLQKTNAKLLGFVAEWAPLDAAISVDVPTLRASISQIGVKLNIINNRCKAADAGTSTIAGDKFATVMKPFHVTADKQYKKLKAKHEELMKDLQGLATYLNEKNDRTGQFLKTLNEFRKQFIFTIKQCEERLKREEEKRKRELRKANKSKKRNSLNKSGKRNSGIGMGLGGGLPPPVNENESVDEEKERHNLQKPPPPPGPTGRRAKQPTVFNGNKSDQMLAALMRQDSSALMNKLRSRRKKK